MARHQDDEKRERILKSAVEAFITKGYTTTTMKDIAEEAGIAPGSIYTYFQDKDVLFIAAVDTVWKDFHAGLQKRIQSSANLPFAQKLEIMLDYGFELLKRLHPLVQGMYQEAHRLTLFHKNMVKFAKLISLLFEKGMAEYPLLDGFDSRSRDQVFKIWLSGMMFTLSSLPSNKIAAEIDLQRRVIKRLILGAGA